MSDTQAAPELNADDKERMSRLSEEVRGRIEEMALIVERVGDLQRGDDSVVRVQLDTDQGEDRFALQLIESAAARDDSGCLTYCDPPGECKICAASAMFEG